MDINSKNLEEKLNEITIYCNDINKYLIVDGFHRTSIYLNNNIHYIKCILENNFSIKIRDIYMNIIIILNN